MEIFEIKHIDDELMEAMRSLMHQLNPRITPPDAVQIEKIIRSEATHFFMVRKDEKWAGSLSLVIYDIPTGRKAYIEDVVVDNAFRGQGIGRALMEKAIDKAREAMAKTVSLTSRPSRKAANRLYQKLGFHLHETNIYILPL